MCGWNRMVVEMCDRGTSSGRTGSTKPGQETSPGCNLQWPISLSYLLHLAPPPLKSSTVSQNSIPILEPSVQIRTVDVTGKGDPSLPFTSFDAESLVCCCVCQARNPPASTSHLTIAVFIFMWVLILGPHAFVARALAIESSPTPTPL